VTFSIVPFRSVHAKALTDPETEPGMLGVLYAIPGYFEALENTGTAFSGFCDGQLLGCAGWTCPLWPSSAELWLWVLPEGRKHPLAVHKMISRGIKQIESDERIKRIACSVRVGNATAERWIDLLGFEIEAIQRAYGPDNEDFFLASRVRV